MRWQRYFVAGLIISFIGLPVEGAEEYSSKKKSKQKTWKAQYAAGKTNDVRHGHRPQSESAEAMSMFSPLGGPYRSESERSRINAAKVMHQAKNTPHHVVPPHVALKNKNTSEDKGPKVGGAALAEFVQYMLSQDSQHSSVLKAEKRHKPGDFKVSNGHSTSGGQNLPDPSKLRLSPGQSISKSANHETQHSKQKKRKLRPGESWQ